MSALPNSTKSASAESHVKAADDTWQRLDSGALFALVYDRKFKRLVEVSIERDDSFEAPYDVVERGGPYKVLWVGYPTFDAAMRAAEDRRCEIASRVPAEDAGIEDVGGQAPKASLYLIDRPRGA